MNKSKLKWVLYTGKMFDVYVYPDQIKRTHAPIEPDLEYVPELKCRCLHLHPGAVGLDKDGNEVAYLYCTEHSGRFFDRGKEGWGELKYNYSPCSRNSKNGSKHPVMQNYRGLLCHLIVAHAWIGPRPEGKVCDHIDTNLLNMSADNLEWVTVPENNRRAKIAKQLRKIGIDPKRLYTRLLKGIFGLPDNYVGTVTGMFLWLSQNEFGDEPLDKTSLNATLAAALDYAYERMHVKP